MSQIIADSDSWLIIVVQSSNWVRFARDLLFSTNTCIINFITRGNCQVDLLEQNGNSAYLGSEITAEENGNMASDKQLAANRANAEKSTGPHTERSHGNYRRTNSISLRSVLKRTATAQIRV